MSLYVKSEIAPLKKVLVHRPGKELENMAPEFLERLLFDDIPYLKRAQEEHDAFTKTLRDNGVEVAYLHELAASAIEKPEIREQFIYQFMVEAGIKHPGLKEVVYTFLNDIKDNEALIQKTMAGIRQQELPKRETKSLADLAPNTYPFVADPMPNLYFTRDPFASIGHTASVNKMYSVMRDREVIYADYIFNYHPDYKETQKSYRRYFDFSIEGGDILTLNGQTLAIGISQRTQAEAIEKLAEQLFFEVEGNRVETILAFDIPKIRAYMHLDTVFTQVDHDKFTVHPGIQETLVVFELTKGAKEGEIKIKEEKGSLEEILEKHLGCKITLIPCGDGDYINSQREQWNDGSNTLCIRPGEVVVYGRNDVTNALLEEHGIKLHVIPCSELSRGRGGPRCMSMPLIRA